MSSRLFTIVFALIALIIPAHADDYDGPKPAKPDIPYLVQASQAIETEVQEAKEEKRKEGTVFVIPGAASPVKTPMAEPLFIFRSSALPADGLQLFRLTVSGANREVFGGDKKGKHGAKPLKLTVKQVGDRLYRIEAYESLEPGEYSLSPNASNQAFCFAVY